MVELSHRLITIYYLCPRYCSKCFINISSFTLQNNSIREEVSDWGSGPMGRGETWLCFFHLCEYSAPDKQLEPGGPWTSSVLSHKVGTWAPVRICTSWQICLCRWSATLNRKLKPHDGPRETVEERENLYILIPEVVLFFLLFEYGAFSYCTGRPY